VRLRSFAAFLLLCTTRFVPALSAQMQPPSTGGAAALAEELRMLGHDKRVLVIGAHPDDEDTDLLTLLVRGMGAEAGYLSLNRGEGGQNLIGSELGEALGLLRTEELLSARTLDGAQQFFTRAYDFGFSKTLDDTWAHWPRDSVLKDVVRIIRRFRPQVIVSIFSGTPRDGHGQHQAAGWAAREAYRIAGDATRFPELASEEGLAPWTPLRLYRATWFDTAATTLTMNGGALDPAVGKSYHQIAMQGRSRHRSQDMGRLQQIGPSPVRVALWDDRAGGGKGGEFFSGIDTTLAALGMSGGDTTRRAEWLALGHDLAGAGGRTPAELRALRARFVELAARAVPARRELDEQLAHLDRAIAVAEGFLCDGVSSEERVVPGERLRVALTCVGGPASAVGLRFRGAPIAPGSDGMVQVPDTAALSDPYFLREPRDGDLYSWRGVAPQLRGVAREPPTFEIVYGGVAREVAFRYNDQSVGEQRRPVTVVPRLDVRIDPDTVLWAAAATGPRRFRVVVTRNGPDPVAGRVRLELPAGWGAPPPPSFTLAHRGESAAFDLDIPAAGIAPGRYEVRAVAEDAAGHAHSSGVFTIDYPHIRPRAYAAASTAVVQVSPLALPRLAHVGYIRGAADRIPEALAGAGLHVELLDPTQLARGDLSRYDAIVVGPRAYETDTALIAHNDRLLAYARGGGLLLVQYQQYQFVQGGFAPFPLTIATPHDRVTDERAAVTLLAPNDAAFTRPNPIGSADWDGWIQERGLYFAHTWADAYRPLLEAHDPGEGPLRGGLLVAPLGRGTYVYTGLAFFRELPAGVPGAYRLFANLLALAQAPRP
jgi:LmbE family N-acetylglucosaminyl deacetylase